MKRDQNKEKGLRAAEETAREKGRRNMSPMLSASFN